MTNPVGPKPGEAYANTSEQGDFDSGIDSGYLEIGGTAPPPMKTLVYTPDVRIYIAHGNKQYDVSADVVACSVQRVENSVSSAMFRLANKKEDANSNKDATGRYTPLFTPMDRVIIMMKRIEWVQVFSGFLDRVPLAQLYPGTVDFRASCTLKKLLHTWWDPGLAASAGLFTQATNNINEADGTEGFDAAGQATQRDAGLGSTLRRIMVSVGNWESQNIHIQRFPMGYYNFMKQQLESYKGTEQAVEKFRWMLLGDDTSGGVGPAAGNQVGTSKGAYVVDQASRKIEVIRAVDERAMGPTTKDIALGQAIGTGATGGKDEKDQPGWNASIELGKNYSEAAQKNDAAVHCFMVVQAESHWTMYANNGVPESLKYPHEDIGMDHLSVGLFQQQPGWGSVGQRMNPRESASMFLAELDKFEWRNMDRATACQRVQRSGTASGSNYAVFEQTAIEEVKAIRTATGAPSGAPGQSSGIPSLGATAVGTAPPPIIAGLSGGGNVIPGTPTVNGQPSPAAATQALGKPQFDLAKAISYGQSRLGTPYIYGAPGPENFDCSSFTQWCYRSMGIEIGRDTNAQRANGQKISMEQAVPGDLLQPASGGHVVIWLGGGMIMHCPQTGDVVKISNLYFTPASVLHFPPAEYGGTYPVPFDIPTGPGAAPGTVAQGSSGGTTTTGSTEPIARNLFSYQFEPGKFMNGISNLYGNGAYGSPAEAAFINDEPLIQTVVGLCKAGLRNFQSLPNGDFCAYYPDYFGLDGKDAVMDLEDIEMKNVQIDLNDDALATHVYVAGSNDPRGATMSILGWLNTKGIATVENEWLFRRMSLAAPQVRGGEMRSGPEIMRKYGARPLVQAMSAIQSGDMEFLMALQIFMTKWAEQYSTSVEFAFMPELYPGMRINLVGHNLQVYVSGVTHSGDFENGFTTSATIMAPSTPDIRRIQAQLEGEFKGGWDQRDVNGNTLQWMNPGTHG